MSVVESVEQFLAGAGDAVSAHPLAAAALALAADMDNPRTSATARSMSAGKLFEAVDRLAAMKPEEDKPKGILYELRQRTAQGGSGA